MRLWFAIGILFLTASCKSMGQFDYGHLKGTWKKSMREQKGDTLVFRPLDYQLPRARGREKMEFGEEGMFTYHLIAPSDGYLKCNGSYLIEKENNVLRINYKLNSKMIENSFVITELSEDIFCLKMVTKE